MALVPGTLERLQRALGPDQPNVVGGDRRYCVQLRLTATTEAEALFSGAARWREALHSLGLPPWPLARAEVLTLEEFDREQAGTAAHIGPPVFAPISSSVSDRRDEGADDLLSRALRDRLTGLISRELFADRLRWALADDGATGNNWMVLVFDLDQFGAFNRSAGAAAGDRVLSVLASRISHVSDYATVARLGGDEFSILVRVPAGGDANEIGERLLMTIRAPIQTEGGEVAVTASVGAASSAPMSYPDDLMRDAASAMCVAKAEGGDCFRRYDASIAVDRRRLEFDADPAPDRLANVLLLERAALAANECQTLEDAAAIVLQQVCAHTGWPLGHLSLVDSIGQSVQPTAIWHTPGPDHFESFRQACNATVVGLGQGVAGRALETASSAGIADISTAPSFPASIAAAAAEVDICAAVAFPILVGSEVVAFLEFYCSGRRQIYDSLREVMEGVCAQLGRVVERSRAQVALARSEKKYRTLADSVPVLMWMSDRDGQVSLYNRAWLEFTGRTLEQAMNDHGVAEVHPDDIGRCIETYVTAFECREPFELNYRLRRADGEYRVIADRAQPIGTGDDFQGYVGGGIDVTERDQAQAALRNTESRLRALLATSGAMIVLVGADGTVIADYQGTSGGLGYPEGSTLGRMSFEFVHPDDLAATAEAFATALDQPGLSRPFRCRVAGADGNWRSVEAVGNNLLDYSPVGAIVISAVDISERVIAEEALATAEANLRRAGDLAPVGLWQVNTLTGETSWSDEMFRILGLPGGAALALPEFITQVVHPDDRVRLAQLTAAPALDQAAHVIEFRVVRPDGAIRRVRTRSMCVPTMTGGLTAISGTLEDITEVLPLDEVAGRTGAA